MLTQLLQSKRVLLADGATGTNLFNAGLTSGDAPEMWNELHPERITDLHQGFVDAGADIILTNSFGCNARRLMLHKLESRTRELNRIAASLARAVADKAGHPVIVAGSVGPTGDLFAPLGVLTEDDAVEVFSEQIAGLKEGGAHVVWIETMSAFEEIRAAALAAQRHQMPFVLTASFDTAGRTMMGVTPEAFAENAAGFEPAAIGANCGVGASDLLMSILAMSEAMPSAVIIAKGNCGIPRVSGDKVSYTGTPELMAEYARLAIDAGARIIGGCCGTANEHLAAMRRAIDEHVPRSRPDLTLITNATGPLVSPPPSAETTERAADRASVRRRRSA